MDEDNYIELKHVCKRYIGRDDPISVLDDFSLKVSKSKVLGIYGPNGCGKTTILGIMAGFLTYDNGEILLEDKPIVTGQVGCLFQNYSASLFPWLSIADNISFSMILKGISRAERLHKVQSITESLGINIKADKYPYQLSGGQQQLVALARALCDSPKALVMDEPFSSLDASTRASVRSDTMRIVDELNITAVFVSHNLEDCIACSDNIIFLTSSLPTQIYNITEVNLEGMKAERRIHSDIFAERMDDLEKIALAAMGA